MLNIAPPPGSAMSSYLSPRLSAALINDDLMIDCAEDTADFIAKNSGALDHIQNLLITHTHSDHYDPKTIMRYFGRDLRVWAEEKAENMILSDMPHLQKSVLTMFQENKVGRYTVIPVPSNHSVEDPSQAPCSFILSDGEKTIFWGCDGAWIPNYSWHEMKKHTFDLMVLDCTLGEAKGDYRIFEHNNLAMVKEMTYIFRTEKLLKENGKVMVTHMSKYAHKSHEELCQQLAAHDIGVAYDGLKIEI